MESAVSVEKSGSNPVDDISSEVTNLSTRLLQAIDHQADLEDQVRVLRRELDLARRAKMKIEDDIAQGLYVKRDIHLNQIKLRQEAEKSIEELNAEIEELSATLFGEANEMVAKAKRETAEWAKANEHLQMQLDERDVLLENLQQQVSGLKLVIQDLSEEEELREANSNRLSMMTPPPPSPSSQQQINSGVTATTIAVSTSSSRFSIDSNNNNNSSGEALSSSTSSEEIIESTISPNGENNDVNTGGDVADTQADASYWSLSDRSTLHSQIRPLIRKDTPVYEEFKTFIQTTSYNHSIRFSNSQGSSLPGSFPSRVNVTSTSLSSPGSAGAPTVASSSPRSGTPESPRIYNNPASIIPAVSLKEFKLFKRCLSDDIEPTLRLDLAPGLSFFARRTVMSSIIDGSAIVEPISGFNEGTRSHNPGMYNTSRPVATLTPCTLCGEQRDSSLVFLRLHNLRVGRNTSNITANHANNNSGTSNFGFSLSSASSTTHEESNSTVTSSISTSTTITTNVSTNNNNNGGTNNNTEKLNGVVSSGYPLCHYCLSRVRTVCDFVAFLKAVRDRVWKVDEEDGESRAWDEFARLRERMLWSRIGGVFPPAMILGPSLKGPPLTRSSNTLRETKQEMKLEPKSEMVPVIEQDNERSEMKSETNDEKSSLSSPSVLPVPDSIGSPDGVDILDSYNDDNGDNGNNGDKGDNGDNGDEGDGADGDHFLDKDDEDEDYTSA